MHIICNIENRGQANVSHVASSKQYKDIPTIFLILYLHHMPSSSTRVLDLMDYLLAVPRRSHQGTRNKQQSYDQYYVIKTKDEERKALSGLG